MISIISDDYSVLQMLGAFGIGMGFGDKTVGEVCRRQQVDTFTFLSVVNYTINGYLDRDAIGRLSLHTLYHYIRASHTYFTAVEVPHLRATLVEALGCEDSAGSAGDELAQLVLRLYDNFADSLRCAINDFQKMVFPLVEALLSGDVPSRKYNKMALSGCKHGDLGLRELKNIVIRYMPTDAGSSRRLMAALYDIFSMERWLEQHTAVEDDIFLPAIRRRESQCRQRTVSERIANMIATETQEELSDREKEVVVCVVEGMANKEIADHLSIALNTVITHRRNIAKKLQIHTPAGLTIYAIVNNLVDITNVKL